VFGRRETNGKDLRREPIEQRKAVLAKLLRGAPSSAYN
jgi:ATP-dependent DNA ligase